MNTFNLSAHADATDIVRVINAEKIITTRAFSISFFLFSPSEFEKMYIKIDLIIILKDC